MAFYITDQKTFRDPLNPTRLLTHMEFECDTPADLDDLPQMPEIEGASKAYIRSTKRMKTLRPDGWEDF